MKINKKYFYICLYLLFFFNINTFCKIKADSVHYLCNYENKKIKITLKVNSLYFNKNDSLILQSNILNLSEDTIFVFKNIIKKKKRNNDTIDLIIDYGGMFNPNIEYPIEMIRILPNNSSTIYCIITDNDFDGKFVFINPLFTFGYIPSLRIVNKFNRLGTIEIKETSTNIYEISSIVVNASLEIVEFNLFYFKVVN